MKRRHFIGSLGSVIERTAIDYDLWKTLMALHFVCEYCRQNDISIDPVLSSCHAFLIKGEAEDRFLAGLLIWNFAKEVNSIKRRSLLNHTQAVFGKDIAEDVKYYLKKRKEPSISILEKRINKRVALVKVQLESKRYKLSRDGVALERYVIDHGYWDALLALHYANKRHMGQKRKDGSDAISHPLGICWDIINRLDKIPGLFKWMELLLIVTFLHDSIEDTIATVKEIRAVFSRKVADHVDRLSRKPGDKLAPERYYRGISERIICAIIKTVDKENIFGDMIIGLSHKKQMAQIKEVVDYLWPMIKDLREEYPLLSGIFFSCRNHMRGSILAIQHHMEELGGLRNEHLALQEEIKKLLQELDS